MNQIKLNVTKNKQTFLEQCRLHIQRPGIDELLNYLENDTDFFLAPASTRFHLSCPGGLVMHSLNVFKRLVYEYRLEIQVSKLQPIDQQRYETIAIVSLFHDICKANYYKEDIRNVKQNGEWIQVSYYSIEDQFSIGHGEKSVILLMKFMKLTDEEIIAINSHMGFSDRRIIGGDYSIVNQWEQYPLATLLHIADLKATKIDEASL